MLQHRWGNIAGGMPYAATQATMQVEACHNSHRPDTRTVQRCCALSYALLRYYGPAETGCTQ